MVASQSHLLLWLLLLAVVLLPQHALLGQPATLSDPNPENLPRTTADDPLRAELREEISRLIAQLGASSFQAREQATNRLLVIGQSALPQMKLVATKDLEVLRRAEIVIEEIERQQFEVLSRSFLLDPDPQNSYGLPAWEPFSDLVGHSRTSKLLFLDMIRLHPELVKMIDELVETEAPQPADYTNIERLAASISAELTNNRLQRMQVPEIGDFTAILFAISHVPRQAPVEVNELLGTSAYLVPITTYITRRGYGPALRRLFQAWIPKTHASMGMRAMGISLRFGLESGAEIARNNLADNLDVRTREYAILCLSRFGNTSDISRLVPLLGDETVVHDIPGNQALLGALGRINESDESPPGFSPQNGRVQALALGSLVRISDLALAAICMLAEEEPESIFPGFLRHEIYGFDSRSVAVAKEPQAEATRQKLIAAWRQRFTGNSG